MRKSFAPKPWFYPLPVLIIGTYDDAGRANAMNAAYGCIYDSKHVVLSLSERHKTTQNIKAKGAFIVSFATASQLVAADYVGLASGNDTPDKMERSGWHTIRSGHVDAPIIEELPMTLECRLAKINDDGKIVGEIINISVDESILDENGNINPAKLQALTYDPVHRTYIVLGETVGKAFSDGAALKED